MKKLIKNTIIKIILLLFIVSNISIYKIYSQDKYPMPFKFDYYNKGKSYKNSPLDGNLFTQDRFWLGTQWGGSARMLKALKMNGNHGTLPDAGYETYTNPSGDKLQYIWEDKEFDYARGFQFEPTLYIPENQRGELITRNSQIWGFSKVLGNITSDTTDENYERLSLLKNAGYNDSIVLAKSWINNKYLLYGDNYNKEINGTQWIFSINLRRVYKSEFKKETTSGRVPVLTIRLPYNLLEDTLNKYFIKFNKVSQDINNLELLTYSPENSVIDTLGYNVLMDSLYINKSEFIIYDDMLPDSTFWKNNKKQDITLNAYFVCSNTDLNPQLKKNNKDNNRIDSLDIEVKYHGNTDIAINHMRIATSGGNDFFLGKKYDAYRDTAQKAFDDLYEQGYEIHGMYGQDEFEEEFFSAQKYNSHLLNFQALSEGAGGEHMDHYIEHVVPKQKSKPCKKPTKKSKNTYKIKCDTSIFQKR